MGFHQRLLLASLICVSLILPASASVAGDYFLHTAATDFIDNTVPTAATAKFKDSAAVNRTTYQEIGIWSATASASAQMLSSLSDLHVWIGLKNSDDQGTYFDLRAEVRKNGIVIASGEVRNIQGVTRNPDNAKAVAVAFSPISDSQFNPGDILSIRILTKVADSGGHNNAVGLRLYYDAVSRPSRFGATLGTINQAPVASNDAYSTNEDTPLSLFAPGVLGNDNDVDDAQSTLTAALISGPANAASFALNANGSFSYVPASNFNGTDSFTYVAQDPRGAQSNAATVTIAVNPVNDAPVASNDSYNTDEDTPLNVGAPGVLVNDNDVDTPRSSLVAVLVTGPAHAASFALRSDGSFSYMPAANFYGVDTFTYKINDGSTDSNSAMVTIAINSVDDAPVASNDFYNTNEDTLLSVPAPGVLANDNDIDSPSLTAVLVAGPSHAASFTLNSDGSFSYAPAVNFNGADTFSYKANDGSLDSNVATVTIAINPVNDAPVAANDSYNTNEDTPLIVPVPGVLANDNDIDTLASSLTVELVSAPARAADFQLSANGSFSYMPAQDFNGVDTFTYRVFDGALYSNVAMVQIATTAANDAPIAQDQSLAINENTSTSISLTATDVDSQSLSFSIVAGPSHGTLDALSAPSCTANGAGSTCSANVTYTPAANYSGLDSFSFKTSDGSLDSNIATALINVSAVNDAPVANDTNVTANENTTVTISLSAADIDSAGLSFGLVAGPSNGTLGGISAANCTPNGSGSVCTATVTYTPAASFNGSDAFSFKANDGDLDSNAATVGITVNAVNDPPVANNDAYSIAKNMPLNIGAPGVLGNDTDVDDAQNTLTAVLVSGPARAGSFSLNPDGSFSYVPAASFSGTDTFTYIAQDPHGVQSNVATVAIAINPVNDAPLANNATATTNSGTAVNIILSASDTDSASLAFDVTNGPSHGSLSVTSGAMTCATVQNGTASPGSNCMAVVSYTPTANYSGADSFTFIVNDGQMSSNTATASITVNPQAFRVTITSPAAGSTVNAAAVLVRGTVDVPVGTEVGVTVNGALAAVQRGDFVALVPITPATTTLTAIATTAAGTTGANSVPVTVLAGQPSVTLRASPLSGVAPLTSRFTIFGDFVPAQVELDANGDGTVDFTGAQLQDQPFTFTQSGVYIATATVTDSQGNKFTANAVVQVYDREELDARMQAKWAGMKEALVAGDVSQAVTLIVTSARDRYGDLFNSLGGRVSEFGADMPPVQPIYFEGEYAKYRLRRQQLMGGTMMTITYYVYFSIDSDGLWRVESF